LQQVANVELKLNDAANRCKRVWNEPFGCRHAREDSDSDVFSAASGLLVSAACDVRDSTGCWGSATGRLRTLRSPSHNDLRGYIHTSVFCTQPTRHTFVTPLGLTFSEIFQTAYWLDHLSDFHA